MDHTCKNLPTGYEIHRVISGWFIKGEMIDSIHYCLIPIFFCPYCGKELLDHEHKWKSNKVMGLTICEICGLQFAPIDEIPRYFNPNTLEKIDKPFNRK